MWMGSCVMLLAMFSLVIRLVRIEMSLLPKCRMRGCRLVVSDAVAPLKAWIADFVGDWLVLGVADGIVASIVVVPAVGSVHTRFCQLVVALVAVEFIVVGYTHTLSTPKTSAASLKCCL